MTNETNIDEYDNDFWMSNQDVHSIHLLANDRPMRIAMQGIDWGNAKKHGVKADDWGFLYYADGTTEDQCPICMMYDAHKKSGYWGEFFEDFYVQDDTIVVSFGS